MSIWKAILNNLPEVEGPSQKFLSFKDKLKCYRWRDGVSTPLNVIDEEKKIKYEDIAQFYSEGED